MKKIFFILYIANQLCCAQIKNGIVNYAVIKDQKIDTLDKFIDSYSKKMDEEVKALTPSLTFDLKFNEQESSFIFNKDKAVLKGSQDLNLLMGFLTNYFYCYTNYKTGVFRHQKEFPNTGKVIVNEAQEFQWTLLNETKIIDGIMCRKATSPYYVDDRILTNEAIRVTAWYSTKHLVPYGPSGYSNLPGLIIELTTKFCTLYVKKMDFNLKEVEINKLDSDKILTKDEFRELFLTTIPSDNRKTVEEDLKNTNKKQELEKKE